MGEGEDVDNVDWDGLEGEDTLACSSSATLAPLVPPGGSPGPSPLQLGSMSSGVAGASRPVLSRGPSAVA